MFFSKNEVIELENKKEYLVLDTTMLDNEVFYKIEEVEDDNITGRKSIILAINDSGNLYIEDVADETKLNELNEIFAS